MSDGAAATPSMAFSASRIAAATAMPRTGSRGSTRRIFDRAVRVERRQRLRGGLPNLVGNDNVRIGVDELRQKVAVKAVHHAADANEDGDAEHDPANRDGRLTLARAQMGEGWRGAGVMAKRQLPDRP